jgi:hypothetical protein
MESTNSPQKRKHALLVTVFLFVVGAATYVLQWGPKAYEFWNKLSDPISLAAQKVYFKGFDLIGLNSLSEGMADKLVKREFERSDLCVTGHEWADLSGDGREMDLIVYYYENTDTGKDETRCHTPSIHGKSAIFRENSWSFSYVGGAGIDANGDDFEKKGRFILEWWSSGGEQQLTIKGLVNGGITELGGFNCHETTCETALFKDDLLVLGDEGLFRFKSNSIGGTKIDATELIPSDDMSYGLSLSRLDDSRYKVEFFKIGNNGTKDNISSAILSHDDASNSSTDGYFGHLNIQRGSRVYVNALCDGDGFKWSANHFSAWIFDPQESSSGKLRCWINNGEHFEDTPIVAINFQSF